MSQLKQRRFLDLMERLGLVGDDQLPDAKLGMDYLGAMAERAFMPWGADNRACGKFEERENEMAVGH